MTVIKDLLFQLALIAISIFTYHTFFAETVTSDQRKKSVMPTLWGLSIIICMSFPAIYGAGRHFDMRIIPLLLGTLYGGLKIGIFLTLTAILYYSIYFGINIGFYNTILTLLCTLPVILFYKGTFEKSKKVTRVKISVMLSVFYYLIGLTWSFILRGLSSSSTHVDVYVISLLGIMVSTWFLTSLSETLKEMHQLQLEVQNTEKLRILNDLTSVFAHEIRNPMQVIRGFLQLLNEPDLPEKKKGYIQLSIEELDRANDIVHDLLSFGKPSTNNLERINVAFQLQRVINMIQVYSLSQNVEFKTNMSEDCWVYGHPQKLSQCLINILKNAIESMPGGGLIWITCMPRQEGYVEILVRDQGIGMTKEQISKLGSQYYSLKETGTGLGLMVSFQIIQSFDGKVSVTSEKDIGTEFAIILPKIKDDLSSSTINKYTILGPSE